MHQAEWALQGPPDLVVVTEAATFDDLVRRGIAALVVVEEHTDSVQCLPAGETVATGVAR